VKAGQVKVRGVKGIQAKAGRVKATQVKNQYLQSFQQRYQTR
jgi:hypothetical protein